MTLRSLIPALAALAVGTAHAQSPDSTAAALPSVYTSVQAERGAAVFSKSCGVCHATMEFTGPSFLHSWGGGTAYQFYDFLRKQMPFDDPGSLKPEEYLAAIAYLLRLNGFPAGEKALPRDAEALKQIQLAPKP